MDFLAQAITGFLQQSIVELIAVGFGLAYLILAIRQSVWCWPSAFVSTVLFVWVFFDVSLLMESALNVYYLAMAVYGFWCWKYSRKKSADENTQVLAVSKWKVWQHAVALSLIAVATVTSGYFLNQHTGAAWPYLDSFTTWASVLTTYMVAKKIFENWVYWLVIDSVALFLYLDRGLYPTALLMMVYLGLIVVGMVTWSREMKAEKVLEESASGS
ncbi:MAG: nicotinamide mononucleotide transporter [Flavobacteriales bacterium]|jgi:nicotinamide mononucleotide transporter